MKYHTTNIKRALTAIQQNLSIDAKIVKCLKDAGLTDGLTETTKNFKMILQNIYTSLGLKDKYGKERKAKASDLSEWFEIQNTTPKIDGKTTACITVIRSKLIYV